MDFDPEDAVIHLLNGIDIIDSNRNKQENLLNHHKQSHPIKEIITKSDQRKTVDSASNKNVFLDLHGRPTDQFLQALKRDFTLPTSNILDNNAPHIDCKSDDTDYYDIENETGSSRSQYSNNTSDDVDDCEDDNDDDVGSDYDDSFSYQSHDTSNEVEETKKTKLNSNILNHIVDANKNHKVHKPHPIHDSKQHNVYKNSSSTLSRNKMTSISSQQNNRIVHDNFNSRNNVKKPFFNLNSNSKSLKNHLVPSGEMTKSKITFNGTTTKHHQKFNPSMRNVYNNLSEDEDSDDDENLANGAIRSRSSSRVRNTFISRDSFPNNKNMNNSKFDDDKLKDINSIVSLNKPKYPSHNDYSYDFSGHENENNNKYPSNLNMSNTMNGSVHNRNIYSINSNNGNISTNITGGINNSNNNNVETKLKSLQLRISGQLQTIRTLEMKLSEVHETLELRTKQLSNAELRLKQLSTTENSTSFYGGKDKDKSSLLTAVKAIKDAKAGANDNAERYKVSN